MALWGTADSIYSPGTVTVDYENKTVTGSGTSFTAATVGSVIGIGTYGNAVISAITSDTLISIATTQYLTGAAISGATYSLSQKPIFVLEDSNYSDNPLVESIQGVDIYETSGVKSTKYQVSHGGWVGIHTYIDMHGELRVKSETLVAFSGITTGTASYSSYGDADDDVNYPDAGITIVTQPTNISVGVGTTATFSVFATSIPESTLTYQWQKSTTSGGSTFANIGGATSSSVSIANTNTANDGYKYRVIVSIAGITTTTSKSATLSVA